LWFCAIFLAFAINRSQLFIGFDGGYMRELARRQFEWGVPFLTTSIDWFQGVGDIFFSGTNFTLLPSFIAGALFGATELGKIVTYLVAAIEVTLATLILARTLSLSRNEALAASFIVLLLAFPIYGSSAVRSSISLVPQAATFIAAIQLMGAAFLRFGRNGVRADIPWALLFVGLGLWYVHAGVIGLVLGGPALLVIMVSGTIAANGKAERIRKIGLAASAAVILSMPALYLLGLLFNAAPVTAPAELVNDRATFEFASVLFHWQVQGPAGPLFVVAAMLGAVVSLADRKRSGLRIFAITLLTYYCSRILFWTMTVLFDFWRGPSALYFEFFIFPIYAIFAAVLLGYVGSWLRRVLRWSIAPETVRVGIAAAASLAVVGLAVVGPKQSYSFPYPPSPTSLTPKLEEAISEKPPALFRGRVATLTGRAISGPAIWTDLHNNDGKIQGIFGNEMRLVGLHFFNIPGLFQYGSTMSPAFYALTTRLLSERGDRQTRSVSVLRRYQPTILGMLGVRFVVTDAAIPGSTPAGSETRDDRTLFLYSVAAPNLGDYSPTTVRREETAAGIISRMAQPEFDPRREVIADVPGVSLLNQARDASLVFDGVSLRIRADSDGASIILLPLEFSNCLKTTSAVGKIDIFRANLLLTGVVFSRHLDAQISLKEGPYVDPTCRLRDLRDLLALKIRDVPAAPS
jgi:hypothetical protein